MIIEKQTHMPELKLSQLQFESDTWKRFLRFMTDENIHLKARLSDILNEDFDKAMLEQAETFQVLFLRKDNLISLLRNEIAELDNLLIKEALEDGAWKKEVEKRMRIMRKNIKNAEGKFRKLKSEFNNYFLEK